MLTTTLATPLSLTGTEGREQDGTEKEVGEEERRRRRRTD
jgi:hypothetical protein